MKRLNKSIAITSCIVLAIIMLEASLRLAGAAYLHIRYSSGPIKIEKEGLSTVLCLGDSYTYGFGASRDKSYPEQLMDIIKEKTGIRVSVYKEFRINSSTILKHLEKDIDKYRPDLIVVMTGCNDTWSLENLDISAFRKIGHLKKIDIWLSNSMVYKLIKIGFLNARGAIVKKELDFIQKGGVTNKFHPKSPEAQRHYNLGEYYFREGENEMALAEFKEAADLEPRNPLLHWRLACIYSYALEEYNLAKDETRLVFMHGDSSMVGRAFIVAQDSIMTGDPDEDKEFYAAIREMESIIENTYESEDKDRAKRYLKQLLLFHRGKSEIEKLVTHNFKEIIRIIRQNGIGLVLMQYPMVINFEDITKGIADRYDIPLIDNFAIFKDKLKSLNREDLFVRDGHCNANGYKLIAQNVCQILIKERMISNDVNREATN